MKNLIKILIPVLLFGSCSEIINEDDFNELEEINSSQVNEEFLDYLKLIGFKNPENLIIEEREDSFLVNGYIVFSKEEFLYEYQLFSNSKDNLLWRRTHYTPTQPNQKRIIKYRFSDGQLWNDAVPQIFRTRLIEAFNTWNSIRNFNIEFVNDQQEFENVLLIRNSNSGPGFSVDLPMSNKPHGIQMEFNFNSIDNILSIGQQKWAYIVSIGNTIGIIHEGYSDQNWTHLVPGTFASEPTSIYSIPFLSRFGDNFGINLNNIPSWSNFSWSDLLGIRYLWPHDPTEKPFYSYVHNTTGWANWTLNWNDFGYGNNAYNYWGVTGYIYTTPKTGTIPLYKYTHSTGTPYISTTPNLNVSFPAFTLNGVLGHVFTSPGQNRIPVYEWYKPSIGYFFTTNSNDNYVSGPGWTTGGIAFYVLTLM